MHLCVLTVENWASLSALSEEEDLLMNLFASGYVTTWVPLPKCQTIHSEAPAAFKNTELWTSAEPIDSYNPTHVEQMRMQYRSRKAVCGFDSSESMEDLCISFCWLCYSTFHTFVYKVERPYWRNYLLIGQTDPITLSTACHSKIEKKKKWIIDAPFFPLLYISSASSRLPITTIQSPRTGAGSLKTGRVLLPRPNLRFNYNTL